MQDSRIEDIEKNISSTSDLAVSFVHIDNSCSDAFNLVLTKDDCDVFIVLMNLFALLSTFDCTGKTRLHCLCHLSLNL